VRRGTPRLGPALLFGGLSLASLTILSQADAALGPARRVVDERPPLPEIRPAGSAHGRSGAVRMMTSLPAARVELPLELSASPIGVEYDWVPVGDLTPASAPRPLDGPILAPGEPGFYRLAITRGGERRVLDSLTLGVLKPITEKRGASINGYRIGFFRGERRGNLTHAPRGLLEVSQFDAALPVSQHLRVDDFLSHDDQTTWPRYVAMDPRLLDKLELVFEELLRWQGSRDGNTVDVDVHSGFRTPLHNRRVPRAAGDSRHQYGDAADIAVDANGDGRVTWVDVSLVARAVDRVERAHPDLVGGLGLYRGGSPYAHIDVRGNRARWRS
jgi:uncharacterized protein YcbK (DUF882 family)